ncbi:MAG: polyphenol oxidase family protein [Alphaproteobacteria bacterium]|nr:MAG: polyphenol oxidase family protein [Alphaproteobacteria bacterium]
MLPFLHTQSLDAIPSIVHGFFTREGGVSAGDLATANFARRAQESDKNLSENYRRLLISLGANVDRLCMVRQDHTADVVCVREFPQERGDHPLILGKADALITTVPGVAVGILTADCLPILISDTHGTVVAAIHAGWRGALRGIIAQTIAQLRQISPGSTFVAALGPCLQQQNFAFGEDCMKELTDRYTIACGYFLRFKEKYYFNLEGFARWLLVDAGVHDISAHSLDTYSNARRFFSYRRCRHNGDETYGCQISAIGIKRPSK